MRRTLLLGVAPPAPLPTPLYWFDAAHAESFVLSGSDVTSWTDRQSSLVLDQTTGVPLVRSETLNGLPVVTTGGGVLRSAIMSTPPVDSEYTALAVVKRSASATLRIAVSWYYALQFVRVTADQVAHSVRVGSGAADAAGPPTPTDAYIAGAIADGSTLTAYVNASAGSAVPIAGTVGAVGAARLNMGGAEGTAYHWSTGQIAEVLIYDHPLTVDEMADVRDYLAAKWGVTL